MLLLMSSADFFQNLTFSKKCCGRTVWYMHIIIIVTWSGVLYHVLYEVISSDHPRGFASRVIRWYDLIHETWYYTPYQVTIIIICVLYTFSLAFWFYQLFWSLVQNICTNLCLNISFLDVLSSYLLSLVPCLKLTLRNMTIKTGNQR